MKRFLDRDDAIMLARGAIYSVVALLVVVWVAFIVGMGLRAFLWAAFGNL